MGDALLAYIRVYGYQDLRGKSAAEMKQSLGRVWEEIALQQESAPIEVKLSPTPEPSANRAVPDRAAVPVLTSGDGGPLAEEAAPPAAGERGAPTGEKSVPAGEKGGLTGEKGILAGTKGLLTGEKGLLTGTKDLLTGEKGLLTGEKSLPAGEKGLLNRVLPKSGTKKLKAAFLHDKTPELSGWTRGHEQGRWHVEQVFGGDLETTPYFRVLDGDPLPVMEQAIADGNTILFTTSPRLLPASLRAAVDHPEVTFLNCSLNKPHRYIRTYYARMYEAKFIIGAIAGVLAENGEPVGYICDYPIFGQVAGANAFALGVQSVNSTSKVMLEWSSVGSASAATERLKAKHLRLISSLDLTGMESRDYSGLGLLMTDGDTQSVLARPVWRWDVYYEALIRRIRDGSFQAEYAESGRALNYYWGLSAGVVDVNCSRKLPDGVRRLSELLRHAIRSGACDPFRGPLRDQARRVLAEEGEALGLEQIINMDWLCENIDGAIPSYEELNDTGRATVGIVGVGAAARKQTP